jgi:CubicO group peptidase (beta-lactamase class C family)
MTKRVFLIASALATILAAFHIAILPAAAQAPAAEFMAQSVQPYVDRQELAGAVMLVADKSKILAVEAAGWADIVAKKPMRTDSIFWIASQSKPITAAALMVLVDEGKVSVDDPVEKYLPEFKGQMVAVERDADHVLLRKPRHLITIKNVLTHTSGLPFKSAIEEPTLDLLPLAARVRSYAMTPLDFEPDGKYAYSNAGINTAGRVIEVVSRMPFEKFLDERLFQPLGMTDTTFWPTAEQAARIAKAYKPGPGNKGLVETPIGQLYYPLTDRAERFPMPAGGLFSTAHDLARFYQMLLGSGQLDGRRCLSEAAVRQMTSRQTPPEVKESYGFGIGAGKNFFGHGGAYSTNSSADTSRGLILVWLVQHAGFPGEGQKAQETFVKAALAHRFTPD